MYHRLYNLSPHIVNYVIYVKLIFCITCIYNPLIIQFYSGVADRCTCVWQHGMLLLWRDGWKLQLLMRLLNQLTYQALLALPCAWQLLLRKTMKMVSKTSLFDNDLAIFLIVVYLFIFSKFSASRNASILVIYQFQMV